MQCFWAAVVKAGGGDGPPPRETMGYTQPGDDLGAWLAEQTQLLLAALGAVGPASPSWTWWAASGAPQTAGAVARHQVEEAAVHAYDAQETVGKPEPIPAAVAVDGVAEFIQVSYGVAGAWPHRPARIALTANEGPTWVLDLTPNGAEVDPAASGEPVATVHGSASDILLALYGRIPLDALRIDGDRTVVEQLTAWPDTD